MIVTTEGLTRDYGGTGVFDVDLRVSRGGVYGLVGPNGAGKTTLLAMLAGLRTPDRGTVETTVPRSGIVVCPDVPEFEPWLTAREVVDLARRLSTPAPPADAVAATLEFTGLTEAADRRVGGFSRGMAQRLGIAAGLVGDPELVIMDEPTSALDRAGRVETLALIQELGATTTVVLSSHNLAEVQQVAATVGVLRDGRLLYQGGTTTLIDAHLRPRWRVRVRGDAATVAAALRARPWCVAVDHGRDGTLTVTATGVDEGERGIPSVLAEQRAAVVGFAPLEGDLESAFLALTGKAAT